jgi:hypothetical protein
MPAPASISPLWGEWENPGLAAGIDRHLSGMFRWWGRSSSRVSEFSKKFPRAKILALQEKCCYLTGKPMKDFEECERKFPFRKAHSDPRFYGRKKSSSIAPVNSYPGIRSVFITLQGIFSYLLWYNFFRNSAGFPEKAYGR